MKVNIFSQNRVMIIGAPRVALRSVVSSLGTTSLSSYEFHTLEELKKAAGVEWYRCLMVGICRNPYDLAVSLHFWYQQAMDPKSMTLSTSIRDTRWKEIFNDILQAMVLLDYDDIIRFENLIADVERIQSVFGFPMVAPLQPKITTRPRDTKDDYRSLYDSRSRATITRMSRKVLDMYDYSF